MKIPYITSEYSLDRVFRKEIPNEIGETRDI